MDCTDPGFAHGWWTFYLSVLGSIALGVVTICFIAVVIALAYAAVSNLDD